MESTESALHLDILILLLILGLDRMKSRPVWLSIAVIIAYEEIVVSCFVEEIWCFVSQVLRTSGVAFVATLCGIRSSRGMCAYHTFVLSNGRQIRLLVSIAGLDLEISGQLLGLFSVG